MGCKQLGGACDGPTGYRLHERCGHHHGSHWNSVWLLRVVVQPWLKDCDKQQRTWENISFSSLNTNSWT